MSDDTKPPKRPTAQSFVAVEITTPRSTRALTNKPILNVPSVIIEDPTPVNIPIEQLIARRTKETLKSADAANEGVATMRLELALLKTNHDAVEKKVNDLDSKVDELALSSSRVEGQLEILVKIADKQQDLIIHREKVTIEREQTQERVQLEDTADEKKYKRQQKIKILAIIATAVTIIATAIAALIKGFG